MKKYMYFFLLLIQGCDANLFPQEARHLSKVLNMADKDSVTFLSEHVGPDYEDVCVLPHYPQSLDYDDIPPSDDSREKIRAINQFIRNTDLEDSEGLGYIVLWNADAFTAYTTCGSGPLSILRCPIRKDSYRIAFVKIFNNMNFLPYHCASIEDMAFIKYERDNTTYLTFGVIKK